MRKKKIQNTRNQKLKGTEGKIYARVPGKE